MKTSLDRRTFIELSAMTTALLTAGQLPTLGAQRRIQPRPAGKPGLGVDGHLGPWASKPLVGYHRTFRPGTGKTAENYTLTYKILQWNSPRAPGVSKNLPIGSITITRKLEEGTPIFEIDQTVNYHAMKNRLKARIVCNGCAPVSWSVHTYGEGRNRTGLTELKETGHAKDKKIIIDNGTFTTELKTTCPLITQWTLLDLLMNEKPSTIDRQVDLLEDLTLLKPDHHLCFDGQIELPLATGKARLATVAQLGFGVNPTHYLIDDAGRVQLVTKAILSWALESIESV